MDIYEAKVLDVNSNVTIVIKISIITKELVVNLLVVDLELPLRTIERPVEKAKVVLLVILFLKLPMQDNHIMITAVLVALVVSEVNRIFDVMLVI